MHETLHRIAPELDYEIQQFFPSTFIVMFMLDFQLLSRIISLLQYDFIALDDLFLAILCDIAK